MLTYQDAEKYIKLGFSLVPVLPGRKIPFWKLLPKVNGKPSWKPYQNEIATKEEVRGWFKQYDRLNMAVACGSVSRGLVVIDFDIEAQRNWSAWKKLTWPLCNALPTAQTGKGKHVYLRYRGETVSIHLAKTTEGGIMIESRGNGALCMLPPSKHPCGSFYTWVNRSPMEMPIVSDQQYLLLLGAATALNKMEDKIYVPRIFDEDELENYRSEMNGRLIAYARAALINLSKELGKTMEGSRNIMLNKSSFICGQFVGAGLIERTAVESKLEEACIANGYIEDDGQGAFEKTMKSGVEAGIKKPVDKMELIQRLTRGYRN